MPFKTQSIMSQRVEFCLLASKPGTNVSDICRRFRIARRTGYKWLDRYEEQGLAGLMDQSRRPHHFPNQTSHEIEEYVVALRKSDPEWGSKKLHKLICNDKESGKYKHGRIPCKETITRILDRNGLIDPNRSKLTKGFERFVHQYPNELWQMDYKGWFWLLNKQQCHPLTITDDHSRFNLCLQACKNQQSNTVKNVLINIFSKYGLPYMMLTDNAGPWGSAGADPIEGSRCFTELEKWLIQLNIKLIHGRPYHPQTQGKEERFHRTLKQELLEHEQFHDHDHCQKRFDNWREKYNCIRPHEALDFKTPSELYDPSFKTYPEKIKPFEYDMSDIKRKVQSNGIISFKNKEFKVGKAFTGEYIALRESTENNIYKVYFCNQLLRIISL
jgi:transposase InsO family protein